ncbi:hypothetical protein GNQ08_08130 [Paenibacillus macerans]|uniref:Tc1-like transposase DDE domain-containing protein n=1 Tax=Paenibacillus macerans TaxID=44252 RepID=A0A6N8ER29_PAEMA|nr:hypothetical protein [Paenibacillus macerans]
MDDSFLSGTTIQLVSAWQTSKVPTYGKHARLQVVFLPPYSPNLDPVEGLWLCLKADVVNNFFFEKFYKIKLHVSQFMKRINKNPMETIDRLLVRFLILVAVYIV